MSISIRLARPDDHPTIARLFLELRVPDPPPGAEQFEKRMLPTVCIAEEDGAPVGYSFWLEPTAHVAHVVVDPSARNRGVGRALMDFVREKMIAAGRTRWSLNVKKDNAPAIALYRRKGFQVTSERWLLRSSFEALSRLARSPADSFAPEGEDDARIAERFGIDRGRFDLWRAHPGRILVALRSGAAIVGFGAFDPSFPGFSMFHVANLDFAGTLAEAARPSAKEDRVHVFVESAELARSIPGEILNEILYMTGSLEKHRTPVDPPPRRSSRG